MCKRAALKHDKSPGWDSSPSLKQSFTQSGFFNNFLVIFSLPLGFFSTIQVYERVGVKEFQLAQTNWLIKFSYMIDFQPLGTSMFSKIHHYQIQVPVWWKPTGLTLAHFQWVCVLYIEPYNRLKKLPCQWGNLKHVLMLRIFIVSLNACFEIRCESSIRSLRKHFKTR